MKQTTYHSIVDPHGNTRIVYAIEFLSQPDNTLVVREPEITRKSDRILPIAREQDIVVLSQKTDRTYHTWLRSMGLSTDNIYEFDVPTGIPLTESIIENKNPLASYLAQYTGNFILAPVYSGKLELAAAQALDIPLFGNAENITSQFYDKWSFKQIAQKLGVPVPEGGIINTAGTVNGIIKDIEQFMHQTGEAIVKAVSSASGANLYCVAKDNLEEIAQRIVGKGKYIAEVKYSIDYDLNDQWGIDREGNIHFLGIAHQEIEGLSHQGNREPVTRPPLEERLPHVEVIANNMRDAGFIGVLGLDEIYSGDQILFIENNCRLNGSTFGRAIVDRVASNIQINAWVTRPIKCKVPLTFPELKRATEKFIYQNTRTDVCFFPYNLSFISDSGEFIGLFAGESSEVVEKTYKEVTAILS